MEPLRKAAEKAVHDLPGVTSVTAVLTAERAPQGTGGQGGGAEPAAQRPHGHSKPSPGPGGTMIPGIRSILAVADRQSVVYGQNMSVLVDPGGLHKHKKNKTQSI